MSDKPESDGTFWNRVKIIRESPLSAAEKSTLAVINEHMGQRMDGWCWAGRERIANYLSIKVRGLRKRLTSLSDRGLIRSQIRPNRTRAYQVIFGAVSSLNRSPSTGDTGTPGPVNRSPSTDRTTINNQ